MKKGKKAKRILVWSVVFILAAAYIARVYYVTAKYKIPTEVYHIGDAVETENFSLTVENVKCYRVEDYFKAYPELRKDYYIELARPDYGVQYIAVCTVAVTCKHAGVQDYEVYTNSIRFAASEYSNCDLIMSQELSGIGLDYPADAQQAGAVFRAQLAYAIIDNYLSDKLAKELGGIELQYEISCYPVRKYISLGGADDHLIEVGE